MEVEKNISAVVYAYELLRTQGINMRDNAKSYFISSIA
jgi:hypothetical protein